MAEGSGGLARPSQRPSRRPRQRSREGPIEATSSQQEETMTAIRGYVAPTDDSNALGVHSLDQFVFAVPDLKLAESFYSDFGLDLTSIGNALHLKTFDHDHRWGAVIDAPQSRVHHLSSG